MRCLLRSLRLAGVLIYVDAISLPRKKNGGCREEKNVFCDTNPVLFPSLFSVSRSSVFSMPRYDGRKQGHQQTYLSVGSPNRLSRYFRESEMVLRIVYRLQSLRI